MYYACKPARKTKKKVKGVIKTSWTRQHGDCASEKSTWFLTVEWQPSDKHDSFRLRCFIDLSVEAEGWIRHSQSRALLGSSMAGMCAFGASFSKSPWKRRRRGKVAQGQTHSLLSTTSTACKNLCSLPPCCSKPVPEGHVRWTARDGREFDHLTA